MMCKCTFSDGSCIIFNNDLLNTPISIPSEIIAVSVTGAGVSADLSDNATTGTSFKIKYSDNSIKKHLFIKITLLSLILVVKLFSYLICLIKYKIWHSRSGLCLLLF